MDSSFNNDVVSFQEEEDDDGIAVVTIKEYVDGLEAQELVGLTIGCFDSYFE